METEMTRSKWFIPGFSVALGVVMLAALWIGGDPTGGVISLAILVAFGALVLLGGRSETIRLHHLPPQLSHKAPFEVARMVGPLPTFADAERELVHRALSTTSGNKVQAAKLLRISRKKLYAKIAKYGLRG